MSDAFRKRSLWLSILVLVVVGLAAYSNGFQSPFVFDDRLTIEESWNVRQLPDIVAALGAADGSCASGRPLVALSLAVNFAIADAVTGNGLDVVGYHVFNILAQLAGAVCLLLLARTVLARCLAERSAPLVAFAIAVLWIVHPLHTTAINHVSYRNETITACFYLLTLLGADRALDSERPLRWILLSTVACALGMASKELMVSAPLIVLLWDRAVHSTGLREALRRHWKLHLSLGSTWLVLAGCLAVAERGEYVGFGAQGISGWRYLLTQTEVLLHYLRLVFWPAPLVLDASDWPIAESLADVWPAAVAVLALFGASVWATWRRSPLGVVALGIFAVLAPTSSFIPITGATMAEHRMVLPLAGVITLAVLAAHRLLVRAPVLVKRTALVLVVGVVGALAVATFQRNADYHTLLGIWQDTLDKRPRNTRAYEHICDQYKAAGRIDLAEAAYRKSLSIDPGQRKAWYNLGLLLAGTNRMKAAKAAFSQALTLDPDLTLEAFKVGWLAVTMGRIRSGAQNMRSALQISPELATQPGLLPGCLRLVWICAVAREPALYDPVYGATLARRLIAVLDRAATPEELAGRARARDCLAIALANQGRREEALAASAEALADARAAGRPKLVEEIQARHRIFQAGRRFRAPAAQKPWPS